MSDAGTQQTRFTWRSNALALGLALAIAATAQAATFTVTNTEDFGAGSLRQAIEDANAAAGADVIEFQIAKLPNTIVLISGGLLVTDSVDIQGPGAASLTVTGNTSFRVFHIDSDAALIDVTISGLTISGGNALQGAGIFDNGENLTLDRVVLTSNSATSDGGGLWVGGPAMSLTLRDSTVSGNTSDRDGGGIYVEGMDGTLLIEQSTVSGNLAGRNGGGIYFAALSAEVTLEHSTIAGNFTTLEGGGIYAASVSVTLDQTIVSDNMTTTDNDLANDSDGSFDARFSLIETPGTANLNDNGGNVLNQDPQLGPLGGNGGPTPTHLPAVTSPVVNAGDPAFTPPPAADQRGFPRVVNGRIDIGSVELGAGTVQFSSPVYNINENGIAATITVTRMGGNSGAVSVSYQTSNGTALQPGDYLPAAGTLNWADGDDTPKTFQVTIVDDGAVEGNETVNLALSAPQGATLGSPSTAVLTIVDDDQVVVPVPVPGIPTLGDAGKVLFAGLFGLAALLLLRRRRLSV